MASIAITGTPSQAGKGTVTVAGTGFTAGQFISVLVNDPEYGSNLTALDGSSVTQGRQERIVRADTTGAWSFLYTPTFNAQYTFSARPMAEQAITTTALATATLTPTQPNT